MGKQIQLIGENLLNDTPAGFESSQVNIKPVTALKEAQAQTTFDENKYDKLFSWETVGSVAQMLPSMPIISGIGDAISTRIPEVKLSDSVSFGGGGVNTPLVTNSQPVTDERLEQYAKALGIPAEYWEDLRDSKDMTEVYTKAGKIMKDQKAMEHISTVYGSTALMFGSSLIDPSNLLLNGPLNVLSATAKSTSVAKSLAVAGALKEANASAKVVEAATKAGTVGSIAADSALFAATNTALYTMDASNRGMEVTTKDLLMNATLGAVAPVALKGGFFLFGKTTKWAKEMGAKIATEKFGLKPTEKLHEETLGEMVHHGDDGVSEPTLKEGESQGELFQKDPETDVAMVKAILNEEPLDTAAMTPEGQMAFDFESPRLTQGQTQGELFDVPGGKLPDAFQEAPVAQAHEADANQINLDFEKAEAVQSPDVPEGITTPTELLRARPSYTLDGVRFTPRFKSNVDKALFIVGMEKPSKYDALYMDMLRKTFPKLSDGEIREAGIGIKELHMRKNAKVAITDKNLKAGTQDNLPVEPTWKDAVNPEGKDFEPTHVAVEPVVPKEGLQPEQLKELEAATPEVQQKVVQRVLDEKQKRIDDFKYRYNEETLRELLSESRVTPEEGARNYFAGVTNREKELWAKRMDYPESALQGDFWAIHRMGDKKFMLSVKGTRTKTVKTLEEAKQIVKERLQAMPEPSIEKYAEGIKARAKTLKDEWAEFDKGYTEAFGEPPQFGPKPSAEPTVEPPVKSAVKTTGNLIDQSRVKDAQYIQGVLSKFVKEAELAANSGKGHEVTFKFANGTESKYSLFADPDMNLDLFRTMGKKGAVEWNIKETGGEILKDPMGSFKALDQKVEAQKAEPTVIPAADQKAYDELVAPKFNDKVRRLEQLLSKDKLTSDDMKLMDSLAQDPDGWGNQTGGVLLITPEQGAKLKALKDARKVDSEKYSELSSAIATLKEKQVRLQRQMNGADEFNVKHGAELVALEEELFQLTRRMSGKQSLENLIRRQMFRNDARTVGEATIENGELHLETAGRSFQSFEELPQVPSGRVFIKTQSPAYPIETTVITQKGQVFPTVTVRVPEGLSKTITGKPLQEAMATLQDALRKGLKGNVDYSTPSINEALSAERLAGLKKAGFKKETTDTKRKQSGFITPGVALGLLAGTGLGVYAVANRDELKDDLTNLSAGIGGLMVFGMTRGKGSSVMDALKAPKSLAEVVKMPEVKANPEAVSLKTQGGQEVRLVDIRVLPGREYDGTPFHTGEFKLPYFGKVRVSDPAGELSALPRNSKSQTMQSLGMLIASSISGHKTRGALNHTTADVYAQLNAKVAIHQASDAFDKGFIEFSNRNGKLNPDFIKAYNSKLVSEFNDEVVRATRGDIDVHPAAVKVAKAMSDAKAELLAKVKGIHTQGVERGIVAEGSPLDVTGQLEHDPKYMTRRGNPQGIYDMAAEVGMDKVYLLVQRSMMKDNPKLTEELAQVLAPHWTQVQAAMDFEEGFHVPDMDPNAFLKFVMDTTKLAEPQAKELAGMFMQHKVGDTMAGVLKSRTSLDDTFEMETTNLKGEPVTISMKQLFHQDVRVNHAVWVESISGILGMGKVSLEAGVDLTHQKTFQHILDQAKEELLAKQVPYADAVKEIETIRDVHAKVMGKNNKDGIFKSSNPVFRLLNDTTTLMSHANFVFSAIPELSNAVMQRGLENVLNDMPDLKQVVTAAIGGEIDDGLARSIITAHALGDHQTAALQASLEQGTVNAATGKVQLALGQTDKLNGRGVVTATTKYMTIKGNLQTLSDIVRGRREITPDEWNHFARRGIDEAKFKELKDLLIKHTDVDENGMLRTDTSGYRPSEMFKEDAEKAMEIHAFLERTANAAANESSGIGETNRYQHNDIGRVLLKFQGTPLRMWSNLKGQVTNFDASIAASWITVSMGAALAYIMTTYLANRGDQETLKKKLATKEIAKAAFRNGGFGIAPNVIDLASTMLGQGPQFSTMSGRAGGSQAPVFALKDRVVNTSALIGKTLTGQQVTRAEAAQAVKTPLWALNAFIPFATQSLPKKRTDKPKD